jgi:hypothetical protein
MSLGCLDVFEFVWMLEVLMEDWLAVARCDIVVSGQGMGGLRNHGSDTWKNQPFRHPIKDGWRVKTGITWSFCEFERSTTGAMQF